MNTKRQNTKKKQVIVIEEYRKQKRVNGSTESVRKSKRLYLFVLTWLKIK